jgi:hypothetical protein
MYKTLKIGFLISVLFVITGCAGTDFVRPGSDTFKLGQTTYEQVVQQMGEPYRVGDATVNGKQVKSIVYSYAKSMGGEPLEEGVIPARSLGYTFHNDMLVGKEFTSSFKSDNSNFDETKIESIIKGKTTRSEVIQLFGKPSSSFIAPMVKETSGEAIGYVYNTTSGGVFSGFMFTSKILKISFDDSNVVSDIDYVVSSNK